MPAQTEIQLSQTNFLMRGGWYEMPMQIMRKQGLIDTDYVYREYPKMLRLNERVQRRERIIKYCSGQEKLIEENVTVYDDIIVNSEAEEERVLSGGKTTAQLEADRQGLLMRCRAANIPADPSWSAVRLRRELGDALDAPAPGDAMAKLEAELAQLKRMAALQSEVEELRARLARPAEDIEVLRSELISLGVKIDGRWSVNRLREELDRATEPTGAR